ncbi:GNAT family N-acetyltransferase [Enterovibrio coralii]|uniref:GNAT family acetyltransferase n=1 Tax=Enterovibrio coralii TaxID=294935 RepID=A0A135I8Z9_9GAMM|nr:GNAT family N-acetyltransferase [Enterovibrio coralii]KXF81921.1 GNAT family acetyltransferase [Enterovibrio coralii]
MENAVFVRKATKQDAKTLFAFLEQKAEFDRSMKGFSGELSTSVEKIERTLFGDLPFAHALVLERESEVQGFALYHFRYSSFTGEPSIWLDDLLVVPEHRSKGGGFELMNALKVEAETANASFIAWTASPHNIKAHAFYKRLGAEIERMDAQRPYFRWAITC